MRKNIEKELAAYYVRRMFETYECMEESLCRAALRLLPSNTVRDIAKTYSKEKVYTHNSDCTIRLLADELESLYRHGGKENIKKIQTLNRIIISSLPSTYSVLPKVAYLKDIFGLNDVETEILQLFYICKINRDINSALNRCYSEEEGIALILNIDFKTVLHSRMDDAPLVENNLVEGSYEYPSETVFSYLSGSCDSLLEHTCRRVKGQFSVDSFPIDKKAKKTVQRLLSKVPDAKILLYGACGTGKTQFAAAVAESCGKIPYFIKDADAITFAMAAANPDSDVIIVDEADNLLNEHWLLSKKRKCDVNTEFDRMRKQCIYIANSISYADPSVLRRFTYMNSNR